MCIKQSAPRHFQDRLHWAPASPHKVGTEQGRPSSQQCISSPLISRIHPRKGHRNNISAGLETPAAIPGYPAKSLSEARFGRCNLVGKACYEFLIFKVGEEFVFLWGDFQHDLWRKPRNQGSSWYFCVKFAFLESVQLNTGQSLSHSLVGGWSRMMTQRENPRKTPDKRKNKITHPCSRTPNENIFTLHS